MTWLHARQPYAPEWEEWDTDTLGERRLLINFAYPGDNGWSWTIIILEKDRLRCRSMKEARSEWGLVAEFFFEPGTAEPVAYSGAGHCAAEPPHDDRANDKALSSRFACVFQPEASLEIHGYTWPFERADETAAEDLSRERIEAIERHLTANALPDNVTNTVAHGTRSTRAPVSTDKPVFGAFVAIDDPQIGEARRRPKFLQSSGPPMTQSQFDDFRAFIDENAVARTRQMRTTANTWFSLDYWTSNGTQEHYSASLLETDRPVMDAIEDWSEALVESDCQISEVGSPRAFLE